MSYLTDFFSSYLPEPDGSIVAKNLQIVKNPVPRQRKEGKQGGRRKKNVRLQKLKQNQQEEPHLEMTLNIQSQKRAIQRRS